MAEFSGSSEYAWVDGDAGVCVRHTNVVQQGGESGIRLTPLSYISHKR